MIYNENGMILTESIIVGKTVIILPSDYILEAYINDEDKKVKELKDLLKECDNESIDKIKSIDKKYKYVTERVRKLLKVLSGVSAGVGFGGLIGGALAKSDKGRGIMVALFAIFTPLFLILDNIVSNSETKQREYYEEISKLVNEVTEKLINIKNNSKLPMDIREKAKINLEEIQSKCNKFGEFGKFKNTLSKKSKTIYLDFKIKNIEVSLDMDNMIYDKYKSFFDKALKVFASKFDSEMKKMREELRDFGEGYEIFYNAPIDKISIDFEYVGESGFYPDIPDDEPGESAYLYIDLVAGNEYETICMAYSKTKGYVGCEWQAQG